MPRLLALIVIIMAFFGSGTVPQRTDTRRVLWFKKLMTIQAQLPSPNPRNNPNFYDTVTRLKFKCVRAKKGLPSGSDPIFDNVTHVWHFEQSAGNARLDSKGSLTFNETGGTVANAAGIHNNCVSFPLAGNYLSTAANLTTSAGGKFSIAAWFKITTLPVGVTHDFTIFQSQDANMIFWLFVDLTGAVGWRPGNDDSELDWGTLLTAGPTWHLAVGTSDGSGSFSLSVDGGSFLDGGPEQDDGSSNAPVQLGRPVGSGSNFGVGFVDELMIWVGTILTQADVTKLWNGGAGTFYSP